MNTQYREVPLERFFYDPELPTRTLTDEERIALDQKRIVKAEKKRERYLPPNKVKINVSKFKDFCGYRNVANVAAKIGVGRGVIHKRMRDYIDGDSVERVWFYLTKEEYDRMKEVYGNFVDELKENEDE